MNTICRVMQQAAASVLNWPDVNAEYLLHLVPRAPGYLQILSPNIHFQADHPWSRKQGK